MFILLSAAAAANMMPGSGQAQPPTVLTPGTITVAPAVDASMPADTSRVFDDAVQRALLRARFTLLPGQGHSRYMANVEVTHVARGAVASHLAPGSPPFASLTGGVSLSLPSGGSRISELAVTELKVVIKRRSDDQVVWSGSAVTARVADTQAGAADIVARTLADAVLAQFPGQAQGPISVP